MDYVVHVGDRQDLPRIPGDSPWPVENFLVEVSAEEFFFIANDIGKLSTRPAIITPRSVAGRNRRAPVLLRPGAPRRSVKECDDTLPRQTYQPGS